MHGVSLTLYLFRYDALALRATASVLNRHGAAAAATCHTLLMMSRDTIVCNRSILKYFKAEAIFTELQALRSSGGTLPVNATPIPTMSLAEVTRAADVLCNCTQVGLSHELSCRSDRMNSRFCGREQGGGGRSLRLMSRRCRLEHLLQKKRETTECFTLSVCCAGGGADDVDGTDGNGA